MEAFMIMHTRKVKNYTSSYLSLLGVQIIHLERRPI